MRPKLQVRSTGTTHPVLDYDVYIVTSPGRLAPYFAGSFSDCWEFVKEKIEADRVAIP